MENEVIMQFDGLSTSRNPDRILRRISKMPGIEMVELDAGSGYLRLIGGDIDPYFVADTLESMGYSQIF